MEPDPTKHHGFLGSPSGLAALDKIKNYYTNIGVWISPPERHACFNHFIWWELIYADRILEATLTSPDIPLGQIPAATLMHIGIHARDVFARRASQCQTIQWLIDWSREFIEVVWLDPWDPVTRVRLEKGDAPLPTFDPMPLVDVTLGAALVAMREQFPFPPEKPNDKHDEIAMKAILNGAKFGMQLATKLVSEQSEVFSTTFLKR